MEPREIKDIEYQLADIDIFDSDMVFDDEKDCYNEEY